MVGEHATQPLTFWAQQRPPAHENAHCRPDVQAAPTAAGWQYWVGEYTLPDAHVVHAPVESHAPQAEI